MQKLVKIILRPGMVTIQNAICKNNTNMELYTKKYNLIQYDSMIFQIKVRKYSNSMRLLP